jgi:rsbT antagonist protein RsbS
MDAIPILKLDELLLVTIQVDMHDRLALTLQDQLAQRIVETQARGVLIDITALDTLDTFIGRVLGNIGSMARVLGATTVLVGMRPAVAMTLVELGMRLEGVHTAIDIDHGISLLRQLCN